MVNYLALFDRSSSPGYRGLNAAPSTVDHIAFEISLADYESEKARLEGLSLTVTTAENAWAHWRSLYVFDPEGNVWSGCVTMKLLYDGGPHRSIK